MYLPASFEETRVEILHQLIHDHPFATVVTFGGEGFNANHVPVELDPNPAPYGTLRGHFARANPVWRDFSPEHGALVIVQGPQGYVSPSWYPSKQESGKVVPTWNYAVVHASGPLRIIEHGAWLRGLVERLTDRHEAHSAEPWRLGDAPGDFIDAMLRAIVGFEVAITRMVGKWKMSQNRPAADRGGVVAGLRDRSETEALARMVERAIAESEGSR